MRTHSIQINTKTKKYSIIIGHNVIKNISNILTKQNITFEKCLIVIDNNIPAKFKSTLIKELKVKKIIVYKFNAREKNKNYQNVNQIHKVLFKNRFNREDCIISFGGGITGDVVGFASSTFKRGIKYINIPSTLLSQVDSSIGGKTGINNKFGKNLIGSFYQPELVISDIKILNSLPQREIICGYAEILKSSLIDSYRNFNFLDKNIIKILKLKSPFIEKAIINSCMLKKKIVEKDEKEKNLRKILNFGHTFAHAYEATLKYSKLNHGEAVLLGIDSASKFSFNNNLLSNIEFNLIKNHLQQPILSMNLKKKFSLKDLNYIISFMQQDKKNTTKKINLILLKKIGKPIFNLNFDSKNLYNFLKRELTN